jgi:molecular chaperone DnaK
VKAVEDAIQATKDAINSGDAGTIKNKMEELTKASHRLAEIIYQSADKQQQNQAGGASEGGRPQSGGDVVDAEFEEK